MLNKELLLMNQAVLIQVGVQWHYTYLGIQQIAVYKNGKYLGEWGVHEAPIPTIQAYIGDTLEFSMVRHDIFTLTFVEATAGLELLVQDSSHVVVKLKGSTGMQSLELKVLY